MGHVIDGVLGSEQQKQTKGATKLSNKSNWNPAWYPSPTIATTDIQEATVAGLATSWHQKSMEA